ncbi:MAG: hypothetical protein QOJ40_2958 [Verrucomicrobiota bacterium]
MVTFADTGFIAVPGRIHALHVAAASLLKAKVFFSFDERQRKAAASEGMKVNP